MKRIDVVLVVTCGLLMMTISSCKSFYQIHKDNYNITDTILIEDFYARRCDYSGLFSKSHCDTLFTDSLFSFLKKELNDTDMNLVFSKNHNNLYSDSLWIGNSGHNYNNVAKIDTCFIKNKIKNNERLTLIPVINYLESYSSNQVSKRFEISVTVSLFIVKNNRIIYASNKVKRKEVTYIDDDEFNISLFDVKPLLKELVYESVQPYIKRLN